MAIIILTDGSIKVESESDLKTALAYQRLKAASLAEESPAPTKAAPRPAKPLAQPGLDLGENQPLNSDYDRLQNAYLFLHTLEEGGQAGVDAVALQNAIGVSAPRGMGAKVFAVKNVLKDLGIEQPDGVFTRERTPQGGVWHSGPFIQEALDLLTGKIGQK